MPNVFAPQVPRTLPTRIKAESGTSQSKSGTSIDLSDSGSFGVAGLQVFQRHVCDRGAGGRGDRRWLRTPLGQPPPPSSHHRGASRIKNSAPLGPCSRTMYRALWWPYSRTLSLVPCPAGAAPAPHYRGTSLIKTVPFYEPTVGLCIGRYGGTVGRYRWFHAPLGPPPPPHYRGASLIRNWARSCLQMRLPLSIEFGTNKTVKGRFTNKTVKARFTNKIVKASLRNFATEHPWTKTLLRSGNALWHTERHNCRYQVQISGRKGAMLRPCRFSEERVAYKF